MNDAFITYESHMMCAGLSRVECERKLPFECISRVHITPRTNLNRENASLSDSYHTRKSNREDAVIAWSLRNDYS